MCILKKLRTDHNLLCICLGLVEIRKSTVQKHLWPTILFGFSAPCISSFLSLQSLLQQLHSNKFQTSCALYRIMSLPCRPEHCSESEMDWNTTELEKTRRWNVLQRICQGNAYSERLDMTREGWERGLGTDKAAWPYIQRASRRAVKDAKEEDVQEEVIKEEKLLGGGQEQEIVGRGQYNRENDCWDSTRE